MTQEENLDSGHQANNPVLDQVGDETDASGSVSKNIAEDRNDLRNSCSSSVSAVKIESNKTVVRGSDQDDKVPVPDRDLQSSLNLGNKSDHTVNASDQFIDMTVITQQNSNDSLRDIQSNIIDNLNKDNSNVINISDRAPTDNIGFHSEKAINTDLQSDDARSGNFPKNENSPSEIIAEKNDGNDLVRQENNNNNNNNNGGDQSASEQKSDSDKSKQIKDDDPIARLNALRANISNALKEVKAVLDQHAPQTDEPTDEKDDKRGDGQNDDSSVKFRFVRRVRKKSVIKLDDEEIICNVRPETAIVRDSAENKQLQTKKSASPSKNTINDESAGKSEDHSKKSNSKVEKVDEADQQKENLIEDHVNKTKIAEPTQSDDRKDMMNMAENQLAKPKDELLKSKEDSVKIEDPPKPTEDATQSKEVKPKRKATLQKTASIDTAEKEKTRLKRASLNETKGAITKATKLKRASICEGDLAKLPKPEKKLTKTLSKSSDTVKVKSKIKKTPSNDAETQPAEPTVTKPLEPTSNSGQIDPELKTTEFKMPTVDTASQDIKSQPQEVNKTIAKSQISHPIMPNTNAKIETSSKNSSDVVMPLISSADKSVSSESIELNQEKPAMAVTKIVKQDALRNTTQAHPLVPNEKDKIVPSTSEKSIKNDETHAKPEVTSLTSSSVISVPSSTQGSQLIPRADKIESSKIQQNTAAEKPSTANLPRELIPLKDVSLKKEPTVAQNKPVTEVPGNIALQEIGSSQNKESKRSTLIRMDATEIENLSEAKTTESISHQKNEEASTLQGANQIKGLPKVGKNDQKAGSPSAKFQSRIPQLQSSVKPKIQSATTPKLEPKTQPEIIPSTKLDTKAEAEITPSTNPEPKIESEIKPSTKPDPKNQPEVAPSSQLQSTVKPEVTSSAKSEPKITSAIKPSTKTTEVTPSAEPALKVQPEATSTAKPESKVQPEVTPSTKVEQKAQPQATSNVKLEPKIQPDAKPTALSTKQDEKTEPDQKDSTASKPPPIPTSIKPSTLPPLIIPSPSEIPPSESNTAESQETESDLIESSSSQPETPTTEDGKPAPRKKRKIKKKVIIRRIKRKLSRDNSTEDKVEPEICEKPIEFQDEPELEPEAAEEPPPVPAGPKSCLKIRAYEPGDIVMYADRVRKIVKWKKATVIEKITSISYKLDIEGEEKPAHIGYIKKYTDKKVQFGGKEYLEIDYEQEYEEPEVEVYNIWARV